MPSPGAVRRSERAQRGRGQPGLGPVCGTPSPNVGVQRLLMPSPTPSPGHHPRLHPGQGVRGLDLRRGTAEVQAVEVEVKDVNCARRGRWCGRWCRTSTCLQSPQCLLCQARMGSSPGRRDRAVTASGVSELVSAMFQRSSSPGLPRRRHAPSAGTPTRQGHHQGDQRMFQATDAHHPRQHGEHHGDRDDHHQPAAAFPVPFNNAGAAGDQQRTGDLPPTHCSCWWDGADVRHRSASSTTGRSMTTSSPL